METKKTFSNYIRNCLTKKNVGTLPEFHFIMKYKINYADTYVCEIFLEIFSKEFIETRLGDNKAICFKNYTLRFYYINPLHCLKKRFSKTRLGNKRLHIFNNFITIIKC